MPAQNTQPVRSVTATPAATEALPPAGMPIAAAEIPTTLSAQPAPSHQLSQGVVDAAVGALVSVQEDPRQAGADDTVPEPTATPATTDGMMIVPASQQVHNKVSKYSPLHQRCWKVACCTGTAVHAGVAMEGGINARTVVAT